MTRMQNALEIRILVREAKDSLDAGNHALAIQCASRAAQLAGGRFVQVNRILKRKAGINLAQPIMKDPRRIVSINEHPADSPLAYQ